MYSQIVRYAPGKIWNYLGRMYWGKQVGLSEKKVLFSSALEMLLMMLSALLVSSYYLGVFFENTTVRFTLYSIMVLGFFLMHPKIINTVIQIFGKKWISKHGFELNITYFQMLFLVILFSIQWSIMGLCNFFLIRSFYPLDLKYFFLLNSINAASWVVGYLAFFVPGGLGVKDGAYAIAFGKIVPGPVAAASAIISRIAQVILELLFALFFSAFDPEARKLIRSFTKTKSTK